MAEGSRNWTGCASEVAGFAGCPECWGVNLPGLGLAHSAVFARRFPFSRPELLKEWVLNIGRGNFEPKQHTVICSEHFRPECFSAFGNRKNLKHNAVPTVFAFQDAGQVRTPTGHQGSRGGIFRHSQGGDPEL